MTVKGCGRIRWVIASLIFLTMGINLALAGEEVPRMTKEELKEMLGKPDVIIIDVRATLDWQESGQKILGAVREDPDKAAKSWAEKYPKDKAIVLYCA
jgi:predicted sulfurtransferase